MGKKSDKNTTGVVSTRLRMLRLSEGKTQIYIAEELGCTQSSVARYEHGEAEAPYRVLLWYADRFGVSLDYIFGRSSKTIRR